MKAIPFQQDGVTELAAADFNEIPREEENLILSAGIALDTLDLYQMGKAAAVYGGGGDFYTGGGTATAYTLTPLTSRQRPPAYFKGLRARFRCSVANTGTTATAQLDTLAALPISYTYLGNGDSPVLAAGDIALYDIVTLIYDESPDGATKYWRLESLVGNARIRDFDLAKGYGDLGVTVGDYTFAAGPGRVSAYKENTSRLTVTMSADPAVRPGLWVYEDASARSVSMLKGLNFGGGPGEVAFDSIHYRKAGFALHYSAGVSVGSVFHVTPDSGEVTDIPIACSVIGAQVIYATSGNPFSGAATIEVVNNGGFWEIVGILWMKRSGDPTPVGNNFDCIIEYDATSLT